MNKEEIEELKDFTIDLTDIDELALGLEVCSKKSNMVIQEFADTIIQLQQENQKYKEVIDKAIEYINKYAWQEDIIGGIYTTNGKPATDRYMKLEWDNCNELLDILKEVSVRNEPPF